MNKDNKFYIPIKDIQSLHFKILERISIEDFGRWLETKTDNQYIVVNYSFLQETFGLIDMNNKLNNDFKNKWFKSLDTIRIYGLRNIED